MKKTIKLTKDIQDVDTDLPNKLYKKLERAKDYDSSDIRVSIHEDKIIIDSEDQTLINKLHRDLSKFVRDRSKPKIT